MGPLVYEIEAFKLVVMHPTTVYMQAFWKVRQLLAQGRRFPLGNPVSSANKTDRLDIT